jgi:NNP family nitrate/nitrite transporter-like MFS transporter
MRARTRNLTIATTAFSISFWAWNVVGPLAVRYTDLLTLSATEKATLVATPVLVGSVGRILSGALTDRYGGRIMMPVIMLASVPFLLLVAVAGNLGGALLNSGQDYFPAAAIIRLPRCRVH